MEMEHGDDGRRRLRARRLLGPDLNLTTVHGALKTSADSPTKSPVQRVFFMKRAMGLEPTTLSLGS